MTHFPLGAETTRASLGLEQRLSLGPEHSFELRGSWERGFGESWADVGVRLNLYF